jgi:hypothetical protein
VIVRLCLDIQVNETCIDILPTLLSHIVRLSADTPRFSYNTVSTNLAPGRNQRLESDDHEKSRRSFRVTEIISHSGAENLKFVDDLSVDIGTQSILANAWTLLKSILFDFAKCAHCATSFIRWRKETFIILKKLFLTFFVETLTMFRMHFSFAQKMTVFRFCFGAFLSVENHRCCLF